MISELFCNDFFDFCYSKKLFSVTAFVSIHTLIKVCCPRNFGVSIVFVFVCVCLCLCVDL